MKIAKFVGWLVGTLVAYALIWVLWSWAVPQIWTTGPTNITRPGFFLFAACAFLLRWVSRYIFIRGRGK